MEKKIITKFPQNFFTTLTPYTPNIDKKQKELDKPFEWSKNVLNGKTKVKLVSLFK